MTKRLLLSAHEYQDDEPTGEFTPLGEIWLEDGSLQTRPRPGQAQALADFLSVYRTGGVGVEQSDTEFFDTLPDRIGWAMGACEVVPEVVPEEVND